LLSLVGIFGNTMIIVVLAHHGFKDTTSTMMRSLAVSDLIYFLTDSFYNVGCIALMFDRALGQTLNVINGMYFFYWNQMSLTVSLCTVAVIAVEKAIAVYFPFHVSRLFTPLRIKIILVLIYVCNFSDMIIWAFTHNMIYLTNLSNNETFFTLVLSEFHQNNYELVLFLSTVIFSHLLYTVPLAIVVLCSAMISFKMIRISKSALTASKSRPQNIKGFKVIKLLLAVSIVTLIVCLPTAIVEMYVRYGPDGRDISNSFVYLTQLITTLLYQIVGAANFFLYLTMNTKFARSCKTILCCV
ncbi:unnamed protein product, partial [Lymnaea stagnalis]